MKQTLWAALAAASLIAACTQTAPEPEAPAAAPITATAGEYKLDPNHASLEFHVGHLGASTYVARFTRFDASVRIDPANPASASISASVEPASVRTDYPGDYRAGHAQRPYTSWDDDLSNSPEFFNARQFASASFQSTSVESTGPRTARVTGDLTLLGQTRPVNFDATLVGDLAAHPFTQRPTIGLHALATFKRSEFGMTFLIEPGLVGDEVTIEFNGEFQQAPPAPASN